MRKVTLLILAVLLASCAMGPDYERPETSPPDRFRMAGEAGAQESIANLPWWELLKDPELQRLIRIALDENKDLKRAAAVVEEYEARLYAARTDFAPQVNVVGNAPAFGRKTNFPVSQFNGFPNIFSYYGYGQLSWEIDIWGRVRRSNEAAWDDLLAREESQRAVVLELVSNVSQAYFDLLQFDMQLDTAKSTLSAWEESVRIAQARLRQGVISKLDADQFDAQRANALARIAELKRQQAQTENRLSVLLGRNPQTITRGRSLTEQVIPPEVPPGLPSELLQRRPDVVQVEQQLAAATARVGVAKAQRFPMISLTGALGLASGALNNLVTNEATFGVAGAGLTAPLVNANVLGFNQKAFEAQAKQALAEYEQKILVAFREVEDALIAVSTSRDQRKALVEQVDATKSALHLANIRYKGGLANYLDVLVAQRELFDAELALIGTHRLYLVSVVQLYKALGGGWSPEMEPQSVKKEG